MAQLDHEEMAMVTDMAGYVESFIAARFPDGLPVDIMTVIGDIVVDAFHDGARWREIQDKESPIITEL